MCVVCVCIFGGVVKKIILENQQPLLVLTANNIGFLFINLNVDYSVVLESQRLQKWKAKENQYIFKILFKIFKNCRLFSSTGISEITKVKSKWKSRYFLNTIYVKIFKNTGYQIPFDFH
jgi:hypothetical protein